MDFQTMLSGFKSFFEKFFPDTKSMDPTYKSYQDLENRKFKYVDGFLTWIGKTQTEVEKMQAINALMKNTVPPYEKVFVYDVNKNLVEINLVKDGEIIYAQTFVWLNGKIQQITITDIVENFSYQKSFEYDLNGSIVSIQVEKTNL
jgi:hypothetical protein